MVDILVSGGTVVTLDKERRIIKNGSIAIEGNSIVEVGKAETLKKKYSAERTIEAGGRVVLPGFVNTHTHCEGQASKLRGLGLESPRGGLYELTMPIREFVPDDDRHYIAMDGCLQDLRFGITCLADVDYGEASIAKAVEDTGMRGVLSEYIYSVDFQRTRFEGYTYAPEMEEKTLRRALKFIDDWDGKADGRITATPGPHAPDTCTPELLAKVREEADKRGKMIQIHLAQGQGEVAEVKSRHDKTPVEYLRDTGILGPDCYAAHCVYVTDEDIKILAETETKICHCAMGFARGGVAAPLVPWLEAGCTVGLGTDGRPDMLEFMRVTQIAAAFRKSIFDQGYRPNAQRVLELATINAAKVLGMEKEIGSLEQGKKADVILVDMRKPHLVPSVDPVANLVYYANGNDVETVIIDGRVVVEDRTIKTVDEQEMLRHAQRAAVRNWERFYAE
jgi:5-methylthioadenosine/S-adenosylhomocysteine deaminase